ncbi:MAG: glycosyltransferase [Candidatus Omnitrophica bacterium]|nr:glycosyltransferase [Candidatus Omnitrophota bacterium]
MNILKMTNTYKPLVGGLERSVSSFAAEFRKAGHRVIIVAPEYPDMVPEEDVIRIPAMQNFNGTDFSVQLPVQGTLTEALGDFKPSIVHAHHPFLIGDTALRIASKYNVPLVFTHHCLYEENVHYMPGNESALKRFVIELATGYANLADQVFAPSESVLAMLKERGVITPVDVVPTGIYIEQFSRGAGRAFRKTHHIPGDAFVVGHVGRLAPEKNLEFLARAVARFLKNNPRTHFLVGGTGTSEGAIKDILTAEGVIDRLHLVGMLNGKDLVSAYHAMDVFVFASQSETQGLVVTEAMASGIPVVAVAAPGVREVVRDKVNGCLLDHENIEDFVLALTWLKRLSAGRRLKLKLACKTTAKDFAMKLCAQKALKIYGGLTAYQGFSRPKREDGFWSDTVRSIQAQWLLAKNLTNATGAFISPEMSSVQS